MPAFLPALAGRSEYDFMGQIAIGSARGEARSIEFRAGDCVREISIGTEAIFTANECKRSEERPIDQIAIPSKFSGQYPLRMKLESTWSKGAWLDLKAARGIETGYLLVMLVAGWVLLAIAWHQNLSGPATLSLLFGLFVAFGYCRETFIFDRGYDQFNHLAMVDLVSLNHLPRLNSGFMTYQPPFYYLAVKAWEKAYSFVSSKADLVRDAQEFSLLCYFLTVAVSAWLWGKLSAKRELHWWGILWIAAFPTHVYFVGRVNNDIALPVLGASAMALSWKYWQKPSMVLATCMGLAALLAMAAKFSGFAVWAGVAFCIVFPAGASSIGVRKRIPHAVAAIGPALLFMLLWMIRSHAQTGEWLFSNVKYLKPEQKVSNDLWRYLGMDFRLFVPKALPDHEFTWALPTYFIRTAIQGVFPVPSRLESVVVALRGIYVLTIMSILLRVVEAIRKRLSDDRFHLAMAFAVPGLLFFFALNWRQPFACSQDARYTGASFPAFAILASLAIESFCIESRHRALRGVGRLLTLVFPALLVCFYWGLLRD